MASNKAKKRKIKASKVKAMNLHTQGLRDNDDFTNYLRLLIFDMIQARGAMGVDSELDYCQDVLDDYILCEDTTTLEIEEKMQQSIDGITSSKRDDAISIYTDLIIGQLNKLFTVKPTPVPDLPQKEEDLVVDMMEELVYQQVQDRFEEAVLGYMEQLTAEGIAVTRQEAEAAIVNSDVKFAPDEAEIFKIAKSLKSKAIKFIYKKASLVAKRQEREISDILIETGFGDEMLKIVHDYASYPHAVLRTSSHLPFARRVWKGKKWTKEDQMLPIARRISPHDFYWSADSLEIDDGLAVGDVLYLKRSDLERMYYFEKNEATKEAIQECVTMCNSFESWRNWLECSGHDNENVNEERSHWDLSATVPCFRIHTCIDRCDLEKYGIKVTEGKKNSKKNELSQYEIEAWVINKKIVRFRVFDPKGHKRPYAIAKFRHLPGKFQGKSLAQILRPIEHQIRATKRSEILNIGYSAAPIVLRDETAFNIDEDELPDIIEPGCNLTVRSYPGATIKPIEFVVAKNISPSLRQKLTDLRFEADIKSQIPSFLTGAGGLGSGVRTSSMLAQQVSTASRNLKRQIWLIAANIIKPYVECVFEHLMEESDDDDLKYDASIAVGSIESLVNREFLIQHIQTLIQSLVPHVQSGLIKPSVIQQLLFVLMSETGIAEDSSNAEILEDLEGLANDAVSGAGVQNASGQVQLDGRSGFQPIDTGGLS